jgi:hypothetical protein
MTLALVQPLEAATFARAPIAPQLGLDALTRTVAREQVGRDLFASPYATVTISNVDVYDRFPYLETRNFQIVSDPRWNRLVFGEVGQSLFAFDGKDGPFGPLSNPRGLAVDEQNRVYVADADNGRVLVLQAETEYGDISLRPLFEVRGLASPYDVAYSDGGTPFRGGDDVLLVAESGRNRVAAYALDSGSARLVATLGELGSGPGRFAGPMAVTVGRANGASTPDVYVADAHTRRLVHLRLEHGALSWIGDAPSDADVVTSLDTDQWGNVYAAAPREGVVRKFAADLTPLADLRDGLSAPRSFRVPFANVRDHRDGSMSRVGQPNAVTVEDWTASSGMRLWNLGVEVSGLRVSGVDAPVAHFVLTDRAAVSFEVHDDGTGRTLGRRSLGALDAGVHDVPLLPTELMGVTPDRALSLRVAAASTYPGGSGAFAQTGFRASADGAGLLPSRPMMLGHAPNPVHSSARIAFLLPAAPEGRVALRIFDAQGRTVRGYEGGFSPGLNEITWDGSDERGRGVSAGVYFYRLEVGAEQFTRSLVYLR